MASETVLHGNYYIANAAELKTRMEALKGDERLKFYEAMLATNDYAKYEAAVGRVLANVPERQDGPFSGHEEILYARRRNWIRDGNSQDNATTKLPRATASVLKLTTSDSVRRAAAEFDALTRDIFLDRYGFGRAKKYFLVIDGKHYDSKAIVGVAHQFVSEDKQPLHSEQFTGGEQSVRRLLEKLGFQVDVIAEGITVPQFERGRVYNRRKDIHTVYGGQQQGGIATPEAPFVLLFTGQQGGAYGYQDGIRPDGFFEYTGEGQVGDMEFVRGNKAIRDHAENGKDLLLFESLKTKGRCRFVGTFACDGWEFRKSKDKTGKIRNAIVFRLVPLENIEATQAELESDPPTAGSLDELRKKAFAAATISKGPGGTTKRTVYERSRDVRDYVLARSMGICEACDTPAPFNRKNGTPYLEPHHTRRVSDGGPDHPRWVGAICPTCHRHIHHGVGGESLNDKLKDRLGLLEGSDEQTA